LAKHLKLAHSTLEASIQRIRPLLLEMLEETWWSARQRPEPLTGTVAPEVALLVDSTTIETYHPKGRFTEAKVYFDGKNKIYGVKKEIAVMAKAPHYCLFSQPYYVGSTHDYLILKKTYPSYLTYLAKREGEGPADDGQPSWAILGDKAYVGPDTDTPQLRKIAIQRAPPNAAARERNRQLSSIRVKVECFFGRCCRLWSIFRGIYRWSHEHLDEDINIMLLLTNEHIEKNNLVVLEREFYLKSLDKKTKKSEEKQRKRREQLLAYLERRRRGFQLDG